MQYALCPVLVVHPPCGWLVDTHTCTLFAHTRSTPRSPVWQHIGSQVDWQRCQHPQGAILQCPHRQPVPHMHRHRVPPVVNIA